MQRHRPEGGLGLVRRKFFVNFRKPYAGIKVAVQPLLHVLENTALMSEKSNSPSLDGGSKAPNSAPEPKLDRSFYTWTTMFRGVLGMASKDEIRAYNAVWQHEKKDILCKRCEDRKDWLLKYSSWSLQMHCRTSY